MPEGVNKASQADYLAAYDTARGNCSFIHYPALKPHTEEGGWKLKELAMGGFILRDMDSWTAERQVRLSCKVQADS